MAGGGELFADLTASAVRDALKALIRRGEMFERRPLPADEQAKDIEELTAKIEAAGMPEAIKKEALRELDRLGTILVDTPDGLHLPLKELATFKVSSGAVNISRESGSRVKAVGVFIKGRDMGSVVADMKAKVKELNFPPGINLDRFDPAIVRADRLIRLAGELRIPDGSHLVTVFKLADGLGPGGSGSSNTENENQARKGFAALFGD